MIKRTVTLAVRLIATRLDAIVVIMGLGILCWAAFEFAFVAGLAAVGLSLVLVGTDVTDRIFTKGGDA
jgi:hypothetical protein